MHGALDYFRRAEQRQPGTRSEVLLALAYQHLKQFDQANRYLEMAKQRSPNNPEVQRSLAGYLPGDAETMPKPSRRSSPFAIPGQTYLAELA